MKYFITGINDELRNEVIASILLEEDYEEELKYKVINEDKFLYKVMLYKDENDLKTQGKEVKIDPEYIQILLDEVEENGKELINKINSKIELQEIKIIGNFYRYGGIEINQGTIKIIIEIMFDSYSLEIKNKNSNLNLEEILYKDYDLELEEIIEKIKEFLK